MKGKQPKGLVIYLILELISEKPRYGYEIVEELEEMSGNHWDPSYGTVYGALERLEEENQIKRTKSEHESRKYFELTEKGRERLESEKKKKMKSKDEFKEMSLGFLNIYNHIFGEEETKNLIKHISEEFSSEIQK